ncbi:MAG: TetR/AcrR family transcriptional regulator [Chloroflexi bacterium]|nr:TetR/AcrR family transcriptional regulator [Chloroflexota bacterium]
MSEGTITKGEATHARIVEAAYRLFIEQGFHATSMRQVAGQAGVTVGGIYAHFASKEAIWEAVLMDRHPYHEIMALLQQAGGDTVSEFLKQTASLMVAGLGQRQDVLNLLFIELVEFNGKHLSQIYKLVLPDLVRLGQVFSQKRGRLRPVPLPILARSFAGLFFSYYITEIIMPDEARALMGSRALETFVDIYLHGILAEPLELENV